MIETSFAPNPERVFQFDRLMRTRLAESLTYLREQFSEAFELPDDSFKETIRQISEHPVKPDVFALYYEAALAGFTQEAERAEARFLQILAAEPATDGIECVRFRNPLQDERSRLYLERLSADPDSDFPIQEVSDEEFESASQRVEQALTLLGAGDPMLEAEIRALIRVIFMGSGPTGKEAYTFDGASSFELWGSIAMNTPRAPTRVAMAEILAHETCHVLLFGYCIDGSLVLNPDEERHPSPLREDLRPIDGIFHATFVLARMYHSLCAMEKSGKLTQKEQADVASRKKKRCAAFYDGLAVLKEHARYTAEGKQLIDSAEAYISEQAS